MERVRPGRLVAGTAAGLAAVGIYAVAIEPRWLQVTRPTIHIRGLPRGVEGTRIALLTDLHAGSGAPLSLIRRACALAMRERPHLVALTGDFASGTANGFAAAIEALSCLHAPLGVYAVPGNHDHALGIGAWHREVAAQPTITDLTNAATIRQWGGTRFCIAGVDDLSHGRPRLAALPPPEQRDVTVLLAHEPDQAERACRRYHRVDLVLSGHTHGGQVRLPWLGALRNPAYRKDLYEAGLRRRPWTQVYVSRGVGTVHLPVRFLCRPEVAILTLSGRRRASRGRGR